MQTLLLTFANSSAQPLETLDDECSKILSLLRRRNTRDFYVVSDQILNRTNLIENIEAYKEDICVFLFSGHAGRDRLILKDGIGHAVGIAEKLKSCKNLELVILNGCSTAGQVKLLLECKIPIVIATSAKVEDETATQFSVTFFKELAQNRKSIREAFKVAIETVQVYGAIDKFEITSRGLGSEEDEKELWGIYYTKEKEILLDTWRLPERKEGDTIANQYLKKVVKLIFEKEIENKSEADNPEETVLKRLPYPFSDPIRKLLAPRSDNDLVFYDTPSQDRVAMLLYAYRSLINFMTVGLIGQLWQEKLKNEKLDITNLSDSLKQWLLNDITLESKRSLLPLYNQLIQSLRENKISFFFTELEGVLQKINEKEAKNAIEYLEEKLIMDIPLSRENVPRLCNELEKHLAVLIYRYRFLVHYSLISVKDIEVLFYMHNPEAEFQHTVVRLQQQLTALEDTIETRKAYYKTANVILRSAKNESQYLYLSPFLIDENAYTKAPKANLFYFASFDTGVRQFIYKHVSKPKDTLPIREKVTESEEDSNLFDEDESKIEYIDYYPLINRQFGAFSETVIGQPLDTL